MSGKFRLTEGGRIDRSRPINFRFNGKRYGGFEGDTLASALLAHGVRVVARSFKFHRPRGIMAAGIEESNAIVQLCGDEDEPNVPATRLLLREGLEARSVNCWPSVNFDLGAINERFWRLFPSGFYYKTFMWPASMWPFYEHLIRQMAGWGRAPKTYNSKEHYEKRFHHCDVLVVGAGPSGIAAALAAGRSGARVLLVDDQPEPGGDLLNGAAEIGGKEALNWIAESVAELDAMPEVIRLSNATAAGYYDHNFLAVVETDPSHDWIRERMWKVRAKQVVIAAGSIERPMVFVDNDRPGVMQAGAARTYVSRYGVKPGQRAVFMTNNSSAYEAAFTLAEAGVEVAAIVDSREAIPETVAAKASTLGIDVIPGHGIVAVEGRKRVSGVAIAPLSNPSQSRRISCDLVCSSGGWSPSIHLSSQSGAKPQWDADQLCFVPGVSVQAERSSGSARGTFALGECLREGFEMGAEAARAAGQEAETPDLPETSATEPLAIEAHWELSSGRRGARAFVDLMNDVTSDDLKLAVREGYQSVEHVKRYTAAGMGIDQGKTGNVNVIGILAQDFGLEPPEVGTTTFRPPYSPISFAVMTGIDQGQLIIPSRRTPITDWNEREGAFMNEAGLNFRRPLYFTKTGEDIDEASRREAKAVRTSVGIYDGSPLGKIELAGPDVVKLLNMIYTNSFDKMRIGGGRYGMMLFEDGRMFDDGITFRLGEDRYLMSTGSGTADAIFAHVQRMLQCDWPEWKVYATLVSAQWANICVCGPRTREVFERVGTDIDITNESFKFLDIREGTVGGFPARLMRATFTGELSFEVAVPSRHGLAMWEALMEAGSEWDITPVGGEANGILRLEKGFIMPGAEGDGTTNVFDAAHGWMFHQKKKDFIGKRSVDRDRKLGGPRKQLVGLLMEDPSFVPPDGSPIIEGETDAGQPIMVGHITAGTFSPNLERSLALALLFQGRDRKGESVTISLADRTEQATVTDPIFIDPRGERMRS
jgi:sarcosine oxidase subunit alpha